DCAHPDGRVPLMRVCAISVATVLGVLAVAHASGAPAPLRAQGVGTIRASAQGHGGPKGTTTHGNPHAPKTDSTGGTPPTAGTTPSPASSAPRLGLGQAIHKLKPTADSTTEATTGERQARVDLDGGESSGSAAKTTKTADASKTTTKPSTTATTRQ